MPVENPANASPRPASVAAKAPRSWATAATCCSRSCSLRRSHRRVLSLDIQCGWSATLPRSVSRCRAASFVSGVARSSRDRSALCCSSCCCAFREPGLQDGLLHLRADWSPTRFVRTCTKPDGLVGLPGRSARCSEKSARFLLRTALRTSSLACDVLEASQAASSDAGFS